MSPAKETVYVCIVELGSITLVVCIVSASEKVSFSTRAHTPSVPQRSAYLVLQKSNMSMFDQDYKINHQHIK